VPLPPRDTAVLAGCLDPLRRSAWPDIAWQSSRLTRDGFPVEFTFCGQDDALRLTVEPGAPEIPEAIKLDHALRILESIGHPLPERALIARWRDVQAQASLRWGTWLGLRQSANGFRAKLYLEVPRGADIPTGIAAPLGGRLRMIGHEPEMQRSEFYYSLFNIDAHQLTRALSHYGIGEPHAVLDQLADLAGLPVATALHWLGIGFSIATGAAGEHRGAALFFRAAAAHGGQGRIRDALLRQQQAHGLMKAGYAKLFADTKVSALPDHGVVTLGLRPDGNVALRAGISGRALLNERNAHRDPAKAA